MTATPQFDITADAWTEVANGSLIVTVATNGSYGFWVTAGETAPVGEVDDTGRFYGDSQSPVALNGLGPADKVYARAHSTATKISVMRS